jgi:hypothetical protein
MITERLRRLRMQDRILRNAQQGKESSILVLQMRDNNLSREIGHVYGSRHCQRCRWWGTRSYLSNSADSSGHNLSNLGRISR